MSSQYTIGSDHGMNPVRTLVVNVSNVAEAAAVWTYEVRDLWRQQTLEAVSAEFAPEVPAHGTRLFRLVSPAATIS